MNLPLSPLPQHKRAQILDVLRGMALLGILINNIYGLSGYGFLTTEMRQQLSSFSIDQSLNFLQILFVEGKFYSLFSLLFGIGFSIILISIEKKGLNPFKIFYRRLAILFLIGAAHIYFLWEGDILLLYALIGFMLPLFRNCSNKALLIWSAVFILSPIAIDGLKLLLQWGPGDFIIPIAEPIDLKNGINGEAWRTYLFKEGSGWQEWRNYQESAFMFRYSDLLNNNRIPKVLGMFLLGFYVGRKSIYANLEEYKPLLKRVMQWGFLIGIPFSIAMAYFSVDGKYIYASTMGMADTISYAFAVVPLALAYTAFICLLWIKGKGISKLNVFAPVGRMALTNYIMQSVISILIFYPFGFGLGQKIGLVYLFPMVLAISALQVIYSNVWFNYFQYGPLEWIWRQLTYWKRLPILKSKI